jgi:hypothetical protein
MDLTRRYSAGGIPDNCWAVWKLEAPHQSTYWVALTVDDEPDEGVLTVHPMVFPESGQILPPERFPLDPGETVRAVSQKPYGADRYPLLVVEVEGPRPLRRYYARLQSEYSPVRVETVDGTLVRPDFTDAKAFAAYPSHQTPDQWEADLRSGDPQKVLRALNWLGARHPDKAPVLDPDEETDANRGREHQLDAVREVRSRPAVRKRVKDLAADRDPWIAEAAAMAQKAIEK